MIRRKWLTFLICACVFALTLAFFAQGSPLLQLGWFVSFIAWLAAFIGSIAFAVRARAELQLTALVPLGVCLLTVPAAVVTAHAVERVRFERRLPDFEKLIQEIEKRNIDPNTDVRVPTDIALFVLAERTTSGHLQVEFTTWGAFPVKHAGYVYAQQGAIESGSALAERWPYKKQVKDQWFRVTD